MAVGFANSLGKPVVETVPAGGTSSSSFTAYAPVVAGASSTSALVSATTGFSTAGNVLTSTGASSAPTWQPAGAVSGGTVLLSTVTINNQATINLYNLFDATYDCYWIQFIGVQLGNNGNIPQMRFGTGSTPTIQSTSGDYLTAAVVGNSAVGSSSLALDVFGTLTAMNLTPAMLGTSSNTASSVTGNMYLYNAASSSLYTTVVYNFVNQTTGTLGTQMSSGNGMSTFTTAVTSIQLLTNSGLSNYISGKIKVYGLV